MLDETRSYPLRTDADFTEFLDAHYDRIFSYAWRVLGNREDAEDLTQEICMMLPRKLASYRGDSSISTWLYRVVSNAAVDALRKRKASLRNAQAWSDGLEMAAADGRDNTARQIWLMQALQELPEDLRITAALLVEEGMTQAKAAEILQTAPGTVAWRMSEIKKHLKARRESIND